MFRERLPRFTRASTVPHRVCHPGPRLRSDRALVLEAVRYDPWNLQWADEALCADAALATEAASRDGEALQFASTALRADVAVVSAAVATTGLALRHASEDQRGNQIFKCTSI